MVKVKNYFFTDTIISVLWKKWPTNHWLQTSTHLLGRLQTQNDRMVTLSCIYHAQTNLTPVDRSITIDVRVYVIKHIDEYNWVTNRLLGNISSQMSESWPSV